MAIPKFHENFLPILRVLSHGNEIKTSNLPDQIIEQGFFNLSADDISKKHDSGGSVFHNRVHWAISYLSQGKFVERPSRGMVKITKKGLDFLNNNPSEFTLKMLENDSDFQAYVPTRSKKDESATDVDTDDMTPIDLIERGSREIEDSLKKGLLEKLYESNPYYIPPVGWKSLGTPHQIFDLSLTTHKRYPTPGIPHQVW